MVCGCATSRTQRLKGPQDPVRPARHGGGGPDQAGKKWHGYIKNLCKDGSHYWVYATAVPNVRQGKVVGYASVRREPSRRKIEEAIAAYKEQRATEGAAS